MCLGNCDQFDSIEFFMTSGRRAKSVVSSLYRAMNSLAQLTLLLKKQVIWSNVSLNPECVPKKGHGKKEKFKLKLQILKHTGFSNVNLSKHSVGEPGLFSIWYLAYIAIQAIQ